MHTGCHLSGLDHYCIFKMSAALPTSLKPTHSPARPDTALPDTSMPSLHTPESPDRAASIASALSAVLDAHPAGIAEHALLHQLQRQGVSGFEHLSFDDPMALFRIHFLLFHHLYRLADTLAIQRHVRLHISPLCIRLEPWPLLATAPGHELACPDPLRAYYLDLSQLAHTTPERLAAMLHRVRDLGRPPPGPQAQAEALRVLGLEVPLDAASLRRHYRRQVMACHPDRGGDTRRLQAINAAMQVLRQAG